MGGRKDQYATAIAAAMVLIARRRAGSLAKLARESGVDRAQMWRVEKARREAGLSWPGIVRIARAVGMTPSALLAEAESLATNREEWAKDERPAEVAL
jgi:transcriptional regulator with XRE-family HTH domain